MNISAPFIHRPVATSLLAAAILLSGVAAYTVLPVAPLPRVDMPTISVSAALPGASPETMASAVATPLERRFGRIAGVTEITSTSTLGNTSVTLQFDLNRDIDAAARDVQAAIAAAGGELPPNLPSLPTYRKSNPADAPILILSLHSDAIPLGQIYDQGNTILAQKISQVDGVGQVQVGGGMNPAVRVQADPSALAGLGLGLEDVRKLLASSTVEEAKGSLVGPSVTHAIGANDQLFGADAFRNLIISYQSGAAVRLGDVANVYDDVENNRVAGWANGVRAILLIIRRQPDANIIATADRVKELLPSLAASVSPAIATDVVFDRTTTIRDSVRDVQRAMTISVILVILVVFVFLRSFRATSIPSVAVPLSLIGTFGVMYLLNYSIDNLSLMALTISTGFVVDDAIVVTENIARFIEMGEPPMQAALKGAKQIGFTIVSITVSLLAVFIPILLMGGVVGRIFREFAVTLSVAVTLSALVSLTVTPMMGARLLKSAHETKPGRFASVAEKGFTGMLDLYEKGLRWVLRHRGLMMATTVAAVALSVVLFLITPGDLFPQQDTGRLQAASEAPQDISYPAMKARQEQVNAVLAADPDVSHFVAFMGASSGGWTTINTGNGFVELRESPPRTATPDQVIARLRPKLAQIPGIRMYLQAAQDLRIGGRSTKTQYQYTLEDANLDELKTWAPRVMSALQKLPEVKDVATDQQTNGLELDVAIDRDTASRLGITPMAIDNTLYDAFGQRQVATTFTQLNQYRVVLEVKPQFMKNPDGLKEIYVASPTTGGLVPITAVTQTSPAATTLSVNHQGQFPAVTLSFNVALSKSLSEAMEAIERAEAQIRLPPGIHASFQGTAAAFTDSLKNEWKLILFALLTVYIVLGILYESYIHPITILSTLPSAGVGAFLALLVCRTHFSIIALIGIILLIGIVKKNAIMMIDFAIEAERERGLTPQEAIYDACIQRFRPIMMTTLAAMLGGLPLAIGFGAGSELRQPLGISIVGGLLFSQMLTLYTTPVIYLALDRFTKRRRTEQSTSRPSALVPAQT
jgi:hydrophobe/amphiphile efflux-1 (HAE1) family protein